jgi:hypothetical protein
MVKSILQICAVLLLIAIAPLPIGYYTFLRIAVTIGAVMVVITERRRGLSGWVIAFGTIAIVFNPLIPVYLYNKQWWMPVDLSAALIFGIKSFLSVRRARR